MYICITIASTDELGDEEDFPPEGQDSLQLAESLPDSSVGLNSPEGTPDSSSEEDLQPGKIKSIN